MKTYVCHQCERRACVMSSADWHEPPRFCPLFGDQATTWHEVGNGDSKEKTAEAEEKCDE